MKDRKFKICLVSISLGGGGAERSCAMLSEMLHQQGHRVHTVILNNEIDFSYSGTIFNLGLLKENNDSLWKRFNRFKKLRRFLIDNTFDVIIDHRTKSNYLKELFYKKYIYKNLNCIYVFHSANESLYFTEKPKKFLELCNQNVLNVGVSNYITHELLEKRGVKKFETVFNAYNDDWKDNSSELPVLLQNKSYILSYGRIDDEVKDFTFLIQSFELSGLWEQKIYLVIMGDGKDKENLMALASQLSSKEYILFLPFTVDPFPHIANAKLVALTSNYEGFPMVLVESLSVGTPVVSLDIVSGPSEIIIHKKNGLMVGKRDTTLFSEALKTMCMNKSLYTECKDNTRSSVEKFSMEVISKQWNKILLNELQ